MKLSSWRDVLIARWDFEYKNFYYIMYYGMNEDFSASPSEHCCAGPNSGNDRMGIVCGGAAFLKFLELIYEFKNV
jgi:hypothetical protein